MHRGREWSHYRSPESFLLQYLRAEWLGKRLSRFQEDAGHSRAPVKSECTQPLTMNVHST